MFSRITGIGSFLPGPPVSNDDLAGRGIDTSDEWIVSRTGIKSRHLAANGENASDLALEASRRALLAAGLDATDLDLIIVATSTPDFIFPSTACLLQGKLGNRGATAFDVQAVCSGFVYGLTVAEKFIRSGSHRRALVVGAEVFSRILDWSDRGTCVLFGDGAGAVVLEASDKPGILATALHADGAHHGILSVPGSVCGGKVTGDPFLRMDGQAVFKFAVRVLAEVADECCQAAGIAPSEIDWLIPHQANVRILEATAKRVKMPMDKVVVTVDRHGNTSAASVPLALDEAVRDGRIKAGQKIMLEGVGGGFTWGAVLLEL
ncbi:MAG: 3-oxoacyl-[acyl-carrier-protein] synthase 3 [Candidatus Accumulibacter regalis]|jgi:3-oxoacyl-[acyl-carrier-protein] synthase-3|uniref:Beta-ketoacyl-[acyl-carrier-protein] synthase III n=1 Tax=Accumulibacter regalis TaxID=522306 RepID=A0A011QAX8_ACCRE|nr:MULTISPECIES: beta-ketoacyl-ACP synthase III [unclassified Candidatus Accumulibacter]EXI86280.1 MAG: 3-oxoacyl-[acyl-carrier-protein] synthase 3 [Candidatus Accumulibacter regalis]MQM32989.1 ketoacyl-ACP synthase III [Candidatus Accumulibacter phosphatis]MBL8368626.1 ketoacyl-ACP synthase III [Accumulibacter sp.]MBN8515344.1 ketoacyl-ACP synthase III [Accumulibacter sp.]MBO3703395.1 ketoacyl-ACP synthase III [Accumulibacter sp.]